MADEFEKEIVVVERLKRWLLSKQSPPLLFRKVSDCMSGLPTPSTQLAELLISYLFSNSNNHQSPTLWKLIDHCLYSHLVSPIHLLSLLSSRVIPHRHSQPEAFRLFLDLLSRYAFSSHLPSSRPLELRVAKAVDLSLQLSTTYRVEVSGLGQALYLAFFSIFLRLIDSVSDDWNSSIVVSEGEFTRKQLPLEEGERRKRIRGTNSLTSLEVLTVLAGSRKGAVLLRLVGLNMPDQLKALLNRLHHLSNQSLASSSTVNGAHLLAASAALLSEVQNALRFDYNLRNCQLNTMLIDSGSPCQSQFASITHAGISGSWVSFDIYMENVMDGQQLHVTSAVDILRETIMALHVYNQASWQETFLALWLSALRLVQRERDPIEGPVPHLESRLCILLSIVPLSISQVLEEVESKETGYGLCTGVDSRASGRRQHMSSLQVLGQFSGLLCPPASVADVANMAAAKARAFIYNIRNLKDGSSKMNPGVASVKADGNMRHLIVEACIARNLTDTSAYFLPDYASSSVTFVSDALPLQSPWKIFTEGAPMTDTLVDALASTPASSVAEIEKLYHIALYGSEEEKPAAAKILCGASLRSGWNIQEHVVRFVVRLLSPPPPPGFSGHESHLVAFMPMLSAVLRGASSIDAVHILSLHGVVPEVAASLLPLCEVFGSLVPPLSYRSNIGDESSIYMVFSSAFLFLLRLWKFYKPPLHHGLNCGGAFGSELTLEYLLMLHNFRVVSIDSGSRNGSNTLTSTSQGPVYIDSYPKLKAWYCLNKSCIASTLSGLCTGNPNHQVADKILSKIFRKKKHVDGALVTDSSSTSTTNTKGTSSTPIEDRCEIPLLPAWELLEAIPLVLEAMLTACAHGRLSSRDLTTGLRDLVDFLPAALASIISYFSAEVTRGLWRPVLMNGIDWPSPAANLNSVTSEMKEILAAAGVDFPSCYSGDLPASLPLPMAALLSLTITFKLDKSLEYIHAVAGPALENCASGCPWPSMTIVGSLWAQKVRRWHKFIVVSTSRSVFRQNGETIAQLLASCFTSFLGWGSPTIMNSSRTGSISGLLGTTISYHCQCPSVAPGFLYLRSCRTIQNVQLVSEVIVRLVAENACLLARTTGGFSCRIKSACQPSLAFATAKAKEVAFLGASLLCVAGGLHRVQELYMETIPTWLLSSQRTVENQSSSNGGSSISCVMEGFTLAYLLVVSGSIVWSVGAKPTSWVLSRRARVLEAHLKFVCGALEGNMSPGCDPLTWKAYVSCLVCLIVKFSPAWIREVDSNTLKKLAEGLRGWQEYDLAVSLLERGGPAAITSIVELFNVF